MKITDNMTVALIHAVQKALDDNKPVEVTLTSGRTHKSRVIAIVPGQYLADVEEKISNEGAHQGVYDTPYADGYCNGLLFALGALKGSS